MASSSWDRLSPEQKLIAAGIDIMQHKEFALLAGCVVMGKISMSKSIPTAGTDGRDEMYGEQFMALQSRKQTRWVRLHENLHKALHHCSDYRNLVEQHPQLCNIAQDFVVNGMIYELDPEQVFAEPPIGKDGRPFPICFDKKYLGWSFIEVMRDLLKSGKVKYVHFDAHIPAESSMTPEEREKLRITIDDALRQGKILREKMAGDRSSNSRLDGLTVERRTNWREQLRAFFALIVAGWEHSRYCPPNKRLLPWCLMPSHYAETTGEIIVACDTSGSMEGVYPVVFGEIARIAQDVKPSLLRVIWWDSSVCGEQIFKPEDFHKLPELMQPAGGGGTSPGCVGRYILKKEYKPKALIYLSDGYLDGSYTAINTQVLWGIVDNDRFVCPQGKVIYLDSGAM